MRIRSAGLFLDEKGFIIPDFTALIPSLDNYRTLIFQPKGQIEVQYENHLPSGVRNRQRDLMSAQFRGFIQKAVEQNSDLAITPEYSMPWAVLIECVKNNALPNLGQLWVFGCESIKYTELLVLKNSFKAHATLLFEDLSPDPARFLDPLVYVFRAKNKDSGNLETVFLIQFKTCPMGDPEHFEINGLQRGTCIYELGTLGKTVRLFSLICSDAFDFETKGLAEKVYDRALIIHIQLQKDPRHNQYRKYRDSILKFGGDTTEVLCLNWSKDVEEWNGDKSTPWNNISGSAWYLKSKDCDVSDEGLCQNHQNGLYYTWFENLRAHSFFFNYLPAIHILRASKVYHHGVEGSRSRRTGPKLIESWTWSEVGSWEKSSGLTDGFGLIVTDCDDAKDNIIALARTNPFVVERILALSAGAFGQDEFWHKPGKLDSCQIDSTEEIKRVTFAQDIKESMRTFRTGRLKRCGRLLQILRTPNFLPKGLSDIADGFEFSWSEPYPHQNIISVTGKRATVVYAGEEVNEIQVDAISRTLAEFLRRANHDRQRLAVWFRGPKGIPQLFDLNRYVEFDRNDKASEFDFTRSE